ncbi:hypothetical protein [Paraflavitalea speifideaquila]|uniref:hypothetical protein n=1 Tax=Paraflavitalea speifideaquila TaxID=3076558 RepID=UPI0028E495FC|nr:hypothetical protein [Paraflavitalea speifideiaquila]
MLRAPATIDTKKPTAGVKQTTVTIIVPIETQPTKNPPQYSETEKAENRQIVVDNTTNLFHSKVSIVAQEVAGETQLVISFLMKSKIPGTSG